MTTELETTVTGAPPVRSSDLLGCVRPYYQDECVTIYHGDTREITPMLGRFDLILTDPPYGIGYNAAKLNLPDATERKDIAGDNDVELARWLMGMLYLAPSACVFGANNFPQLLPHRGRWVCWDKRLTREADRMLGSAFEVAWTSRTSGSRIASTRCCG